MKDKTYRLILVVFILCFCITIYGQDSLELKKRSFSIKDRCKVAVDKLSRDSLFSNRIAKSKLVLLGEIHGTSANPYLQLSFITTLNKKENIKYLLLETGYSFGFLINKYLQSGDQRILDSALIHYPYQFEEYKDLFTGIRQYNLTIPFSQQIQVIGIDLEFQREYQSVLWCISYLLKECDASVELLSKLDSSKSGFSQKNRLLLKNRLCDMLDNIKTKEKKWQSIHTKDYHALLFIINNFLYTLDVKSYPSDRDPYMYNNFNVLTDSIIDGRYFGQFGKDHVRETDRLSFSYYLTRRYGKDAIYSGSIIYDKSQFYPNKKSRSDWDGLSKSSREVIKKNDCLFIPPLLTNTVDFYIYIKQSLPLTKIFIQ